MLEEGSERRAAFAQLRSRAHEIAVETVEKKSLSPFNDKVYGLDARNSRPLGHWRNLEQLRMLGRLRSARLCALRPRDGVPRGAPASGARSSTAAAAEPLLGVDCRNLKKKKDPELSFSRFLDNAYFDPMLKEMTSSAAFRCVQETFSHLVLMSVELANSFCPRKLSAAPIGFFLQSETLFEAQAEHLILWLEVVHEEEAVGRSCAACPSAAVDDGVQLVLVAQPPAAEELLIDPHGCAD